MSKTEIIEAIFSSILEQDVKIIDDDRSNEIKNFKEVVSLVYHDTGLSISYAMNQLGSQTLFDSLPKLSTNINIKTDYEEDFAIKCSLGETVMAIKQRIEDEQSIDKSYYSLVYNGVHLVDQKKLSEYNIRNNDSLLLEVKIKKFYVTIKIHKGITKIFECNETNTPSDILKQIRVNFNIPNLIMETPYDMNKPLNQLSVKAGTKFFVRKARFTGGNVFIKIPSGRSLSIEVSKNETVSDLKAKISEKADISVRDINLLFNGDYMDNDETLDYYEIQDQDTISLIMQQNLKLTLNIKRLTGKTTVVNDVTPNDTIKNLKAKIYSISNEPVDMQCLIYDSKRLENGKTLGDYQIKNDSTISLVMNVGTYGEIKINVRTLKGDIYSCKMNPEQTIEELKCRINEQLDVNIHTMVISYKTKPCEDYQTLDQCDIKDNTLLHLLFRENETINLSAANLLDPQYDYDFTNINDNGATFQRGSKPYLRPCGWKRIAIKASKQYENDVWLGSSNKPGEWPVAYHGTDFQKAKDYFTKNYNDASLKGLTFNKAHLTTLDIKHAEEFAKTINMKGNIRVKFIIQSRIQPDKIVNNHLNTCMLLPSFEDLRPYGICYKIV